MKTINVKKEDVGMIGHTVFEVEGNTAFVCEPSTSRIEEILLRNILELFGEDIRIIDTEEQWNRDFPHKIVGVVFITNLPYETYLNLERLTVTAV